MSQLKAQIDKLLTDVSAGYFVKGAIAENVLPFIPSKQTTGKLGKYGSNHLRIEVTVKGGRGKYRQVESITRSTTGYNIEGHGLEGMVTKEDYKNVELPFKAEADETMGLSSILLLEKEKALADTLTDTATITQNVTLAATEQYNDYLNSDPIDDFKTARAAILAGCGEMPNLAIMDALVWNALRFHPGILDALGFKQNRPGGLEINEMAKALGVDNVMIAAARYNSAKEGQTAVLSACWGKHVIFAVCPDKAQPYQNALGYLVGYEGESPRKVYKQSNFNPPDSTSILVEDNYDMLIANAACAYLIKNAIA